MQGVTLQSLKPDRSSRILGTNGAGKTTTLRAISGFLGIDDARVTEGSDRLQGPADREPAAATRSRGCGIVLVPERDKVFPEPHGGGESGRAGRRAIERAERRRREALVYQFFPALAELRSRIAGLLSGGERQMLALGSALVCQPELLLVDELSLGLAPVVVEDLMRAVVPDPPRARHHHRAGRAERRGRAWRSPTTAMCWRTAASCSTATRARLRAHRRHPGILSRPVAGGERRSYRDGQAISAQPEMVWLSLRSST